MVFRIPVRFEMNVHSFVAKAEGLNTIASFLTLDKVISTDLMNSLSINSVFLQLFPCYYRDATLELGIFR
jgi:hypothetical protein